MTTHDLKIFPEYFCDIVLGLKTFEIRNEYDRHFEAGDELILREFDPRKGLSGRFCKAKVKYVHRGLGLEKDFCCMSLETDRVTYVEPK